MNGYAMVIDNRLSYAQSAIDEFSDPKEIAADCHLGGYAGHRASMCRRF